MRCVGDINMDTLIDIFKGVLNFVVDAVFYVINLIKTIVSVIYNWFLGACISEKIIVLNLILAFFAVVCSVARFKIFDSYSYITNPLAVYLIAISLFMLISSFYLCKITFCLRVSVNIYYIIWVVIIHFSDSLTKARPFDVLPAFYLNYLVPLIFIFASVMSMAFYTRR